jgi:hypothetical protein
MITGTSFSLYNTYAAIYLFIYITAKIKNLSIQDNPLLLHFSLLLFVSILERSCIPKKKWC